MFGQITTIRVIGAVIITLALLLALPVGAACADAEDDGVLRVATDVQQNDGAALLCLALVGGVAVLAASVLLVECRKLL